MATLEQQQSELERLQKILSDFFNEQPESFVRMELGNDLNFEEGLPYFRRIFDLITELNNYSLDDVPYYKLKQIADPLSQTIETFSEILDFSIQKHPENTVSVRNQLIDNIRDGYDHLYNITTPLITYLAIKQTDIGDIKQSAIENTEEIKRLKSEYEKEKDKIIDDSKSIIKSMRDAAAETGVSQHASYFKEEAELHEKASTNWLWFTIIVASLTLGIAIYFAYYYSQTNLQITTGHSIQLAVSKLIVFSILYFALIWGSRNYRAHRHNAVVNKHRQNALSTFQAFVKAAEDDKATKDAVLLRSTETIFSPSTSGYLNKEGEKQNTPQILEIFRSAMNKGDE